jgi:hypothetical protein
VVKAEKLFRPERRQAVGVAVIVDEFNFEGVSVMDVHDGADLAAIKPLCRQVGGQRDDVQFPNRLIGHLTPS